MQEEDSWRVLLLHVDRFRAFQYGGVSVALIGH
jgi:hypothetical protein